MNNLFSSPFFSDETHRYVVDRIRHLLSYKETIKGIPKFNPYWDSRRIAITIEYIRAFDLTRGEVMEIGSPDYLASQVIWSAFPNVRPHFVDNDLRFEPLPAPNDSIDSVICCEVLEHLSDVPYYHATILSGVFFFLNEVFRVLKVGGKALFTTPNAASLWTITRALLGQPPMVYEWHFREFVCDELRQIMEFIGFNIEILRTEYVWYMWDFSALIDFMTSQGYDIADRGDDIFVVVSKPAVRVRKPHSLGLPLSDKATGPQ